MLSLFIPASSAGTRNALRFAAVAFLITLGTSGFAQTRMTAVSARVSVPAAGVSASFTVAGSAPKTMLVRAVGPSLGNLGIPGTLSDPQLVVTNSSGATVVSNDNWGGDATVAAISTRFGAFPLGNTSRDAAVAFLFPPGTYTASVTGVGGTTGTVLFEVYDADTTATGSTVSHLGMRAPAGGATPLTLGISATGSVPGLIRALGPALTSAGVAGALTDPRLTVFAGTNSLGANDNWNNDPALASAAAQVGALPLAANSRDSAVLATLAAATTVNVTSGDGSVGMVLVEVYSVAGLAIAPVITVQPTNAAVVTGSRLSLAVTAVATPTATHQWRKNDVAIAGATGATFTVASAQPADAGTYTVVVTNTAGTVTSSPAVVAVGATAAPTITVQPRSQSAVIGQPLTLSVTATGFPGPTYQWRKDGQAITGATASTYTINSAQSSNAGEYTVVITNAQGNVTSAGAAITVVPSSWLSNMSVRTSMTDGQQLSVGMFVTGGTRNVLLRAAGPALTQLGLSPVVTNPRMALFNAQSTQIRANDDWDPALAPTFNQVGAFSFPAGSRDAAVSQSVEGQLSLEITAGGSGTLLVEAYDLESGSATRLVNLSVRNRVGTGNDVLIAGFNLSGTGSKRLLIRGVGPSLAQFGVTSVLTDPRLEIFDGANRRVGVNDNWEASLAPTMSAAGAFALLSGSRDAAVIVTLPVGTYSAILSGNDGGSGNGIIELYELP